jgi:peptide/nickel transport system substrate-binding protein
MTIFQRSRISRRRLGGLTAAGSVAAFLAACGGSKSTTGPSGGQQEAQRNVGTPTAKQAKPGGSLVIRIAADPPNFSPFTASTYTAATANNCYNKLVRLKVSPDIDPADVSLEPDLAAAMPEIPDPLTYVFKLRPNVKFHDVAPANGRVMTADDVKAAIDAYRGDSRSAMRADNSSINSVEAVDAATVRVKMKAPSAPQLNISAGHYGWRIFPKEMLDGDDLKTKAVGTGPFILESFQPSARATYKKNPAYFKENLPYLDSLTLTIIPQDASAISAFLTGQANVISNVDCTSADQVKAQKRDARFQQTFDNQPGGYIALDTTRPPFADVRVRRALSLAFNRQAEIAALECGGGKPDQLIPTGAFKKALPIDQLGDASKYWQYNVAEAKKLLTEAGFADGFEALLMYTPFYGQPYQNSAERAIADFAAIGVRLKPQSTQYNEWIATIYRPPFNFTGILWGPSRYYTDVDPYLWYWLHPDPTQGISNQSRVKDPMILPLLEKQRATLDETERLKVIGDIQKIVADQQYYIGRTTGNAFSFWEPWLEGFSSRLGYDFPQVEFAWDNRR